MAGPRDKDPKKGQGQLELPLRPRALSSVGPGPKPVAQASGATPARPFRVIRGEGQKRDETLRSRDDVARLLVAAAADMMLKRISVERADEIEKRIDKVMRLFDMVDRNPVMMALLRRELDELEAIWREGQRKRKT